MTKRHSEDQRRETMTEPGRVEDQEQVEGRVGVRGTNKEQSKISKI